MSGLDGIREDRTDTVSVFNGPPPRIRILADEEEETRVVTAWLAERAGEGLAPETIGVFVRSERELPRGVRGVERAGLEAGLLDERVRVPPDRVSVGTMHLAKGLELGTVVVMASTWPAPGRATTCW